MRLPDLSSYDNSWYSPGQSKFVRAIWFLVGLPLIRCQILPLSSLRRFVLRCFGAQVGRGVVLRPGVRVKYPWLLSIGDHTWVGEDVWIDNLAEVKIGANCCISQGAHLCTGNHDWSDPAFGLLVQPIMLGDGAWIGTRALVCPGVIVGQCGVAAAGSIVTKPIPAFEIHSGNPARFVKRRVLRQASEYPPQTIAAS